MKEIETKGEGYFFTQWNYFRTFLKVSGFIDIPFFNSITIRKKRGDAQFRHESVQCPDKQRKR